MAIVLAPPIITDGAARPHGRDTGIDLVRALCVTGVVVLHAIMVGVTVSSAGPVFENASDGTGWILPVSWLLQVMPLFFIIGGFAGLLAYRRQRERGATASAFVAGRVHRLLRPALGTIALVGVGLAALSVSGVPADLVAVAGFRYGQPLWFLAVFLVCQALLPVLAAAHDRAALPTLAALAATALIVDAARSASGVDGIGFLNLAFVWLTLQQLGFFFADGTIDAWTRRTRVGIAATALALLVGSFVGGVYSPDLIANINPPTGALLLVGVVHLSLVSLFREHLLVISRRPRIAAFSAFVNGRTMTIYLWHMPVLLAMAGASAVLSMASGLPLPEPSSPLWWLGRPLWLGGALLLTALVAVVFARIETQAAPAPSDAAQRVTAAVLVGASGVVLLLVVGTTPFTACVAAAALVGALRLARAPRSAQSARGQGVSDLIRVP